MAVEKINKESVCKTDKQAPDFVTTSNQSKQMAMSTEKNREIVESSNQKIDKPIFKRGQYTNVNKNVQAIHNWKTR